MKASELRIGNYVQISDKIIIMDNRIFHAVIHGFPGYEPEPIPLTDEWLVKFGLKEAHYSDSRNLRYNLPGYGYEIHLNDDTEHGVYFEGNCMTYIKYTHQLQNLVFALTGEELTTKLTEE